MKQTAVEWLNREIRLNSKIKENIYLFISRLLVRYWKS